MTKHFSNEVARDFLDLYDSWGINCKKNKKKIDTIINR